HEEDLDAVRATAARATALGIGTELLRISSRRPLAALVELISERRASLVVLGPDVRRTPKWQVWLAARRVRRQTDCLIWTASEGRICSEPVVGSLPVSGRHHIMCAGTSCGRYSGLGAYPRCGRV